MKITAIVTLHVDGKTILPGKSVDISDEEAKSLIDRGFSGMGHCRSHIPANQKQLSSIRSLKPRIRAGL